MTAESDVSRAALTLSDVIEADERVALGGEVVPSHVRYVLGFDRAPTPDEIEVVTELLAPFDVVRSVTADGVEIITADRENPGRQVPHLKELVAGATDEARRRVAAREEKATEAEERSRDLRAQLGAHLDGEE